MQPHIALFVFIAGFIVGHGAVTVIDTLGFLGRTSSYWTEATIRAHKVTKPLIWLGAALAVVGGFFFYRSTGAALVGIPLYHAFIALALVINGCFLSFYVSPRLLERERQGRAGELLPASMQRAITVSFLISFTGWWTAVYLLVVYLTTR